MTPDSNTEHCSDCGVCIEGMDHHCPWSSKCIGKGNLKIFWAFAGLATLGVLYLTVVLIIVGTGMLDPNVEGFDERRLLHSGISRFSRY